MTCSMVSYAQNFEDVMLARAFEGRAQGFYVDLGACFPDIASVTKHFYDVGWSGVNVEPMKEPFERLVSERPRDLNLNIAVAAHCGEIEIYEGPSIGESSAQPRENAASSVIVPCLTLAQLCRLHVRRPIDFLKIDVEGLEHEVLANGDWERFRPMIVVVEVTLPWSTNRRPDASAITALLRAKAYSEVYFDGINAFYLASEGSALAERFAYPPNVLDEFVLYREQQAAASLAAAQQYGANLATRLNEIEQSNQRAEARAIEQEHAARDANARAAEATSGWLAAQTLFERMYETGERERGNLIARLAATEEELRQAERRAQHAEASFAAIERSRSWRLTAPLRHLRAMRMRLRADTAAVALRSTRAAATSKMRVARGRLLQKAVALAKRTDIYARLAPVVRARNPRLWASAKRWLMLGPTTATPSRNAPSIVMTGKESARARDNGESLVVSLQNDPSQFSSVDVADLLRQEIRRRHACRARERHTT